jgi:hypothetical protein
MRGLLLTFVLVVMLGFLAFIGCDEDGSSLTGPGDTGYTTSLTGAVLAGSRPYTPPQVRIVGDAVDTTLVMQSNGMSPNTAEFRYDGIPPGSYTIIPVPRYQTKYVPEQITVSVDEGHNTIDPFFSISTSVLSFMNVGRQSVIGGYIDCDSAVSVTGIEVVIESEDGDTRLELLAMGGYYLTAARSHGSEARNVVDRGANKTYYVTPHHDSFVFEPPVLEIVADSLAVIGNFKATYVGGVANTVSGQFSGVDPSILSQEEYTKLVLSFNWKSSYSIVIPIQDDGSFLTPPLFSGSYTLNLYIGSGSPVIQRNVEIIDDDIDLGEMTIEYNGPLNADISGRVVDASGVGIPDILVPIEILPSSSTRAHLYPVLSDETGTYSCDGLNGYNLREDVTLTIAPELDGWAFVPRSASLDITYIDGNVLQVIVIPDFIGTPVSMSRYFSLISGASWTYTHAIDGVLSDPVTVTAGDSFDAGGQTWIPLSGSMLRDWQGYRIDGADMYAWNGAGAVDYIALDETTWDMGKVGYYPAIGTRLDTEDVTVHAGTFTDCEVIEIAVVYGGTSSETTTLWLAENVGPVKIEFTTISRGNVIGWITDELVSYSIP